MDGQAAQTAPESATAASADSHSPYGVLDAPSGVRPRWVGLAGRPHPQGIRLNVGVRFLPCDQNGLDYQIRGVVDVPGSPFGDDERSHLAKLLVDAASMPRRGRYEYAVLDWVPCDGGDGVRVDTCRPTPVLGDHDFLDLRTFTPPDVEETVGRDPIGPERHDAWVREYGANRYCRHETRQELHQRYQDIWANIQVLSPSGRLDLTGDSDWYRLLQHVITEMLLLGEPPTPSNRDPRVPEARPFFDGELCRKAASVVAARGTRHDVLVKYGKREHMEALLREGTVYLNSASSYNESVHNQAVRDDELAISFKGAYVRATRPMQFYDAARPPPAHVADRAVGFRPIHALPDLDRHQYATLTLRMVTDYWMFCLADLLDQRLFADFQADSCLIIRRKPFVERLSRMARFQLPNVERTVGRVRYVDPLGAWPHGPPMTRSTPVHMTKVFRYAYQREVRFAFLPTTPRDRLEPRILRIGRISDIAELLPLADCGRVD